MFKRPTKKQLLIQRIIVSTIMTLAVIVIVAGAIFFILGYRLDSAKGRFEQGALLQFESTPTGAEVKIDGKTISSRTSTKQSVIAGTHSFMVSRNGYHDWNKTLTLKAGTLTWLDYIRLVPTTLKSETVASYTSLYSEKASPDLKTLIVQEKADVPTFQVVDLRSQDIKTAAITLPADDYSEATTEGVQHTFTLGEWNKGGRYILVKHGYADKSEWIVLDTENVENSVNVSTSLSISLKDLQFAGTNGKIFYGLTDDELIRELDVSSGTISRGLVSHVKNFMLFETNVISYVGTNPKNENQQVAGVYRDGDEAPHVLRTVDDRTTQLSIDVTRYFGDDYVAIAEGKKVSILKGRYPTSSAEEATSLKAFADFTANGAVDQLTFSNDGEIVVARSGFEFISYEIEHQRMTNAKVDSTETTARTLNWLDGAYFWTIYDGKLTIREFDGANVHTIASAEAGFDATLSQNGRYLYSIGKNGNTFQLQRVKMILD